MANSIEKAYQRVQSYAGTLSSRAKEYETVKQALLKAMKTDKKHPDRGEDELPQKYNDYKQKLLVYEAALQSAEAGYQELAAIIRESGEAHQDKLKACEDALKSITKLRNTLAQDSKRFEVS